MGVDANNLFLAQANHTNVLAVSIQRVFIRQLLQIQGHLRRQRQRELWTISWTNMAA